MWIQAQHPGVTGQYVQVPPGACHETWTQSDGTHMTLRSVHAEDAEELNAMVKRLSYESRRNRFHSAINALTPKTLERMVPFVSAYIDQVELPQKLIRVDWQPEY